MVRKITENDREVFLRLAKEMYASDAVLKSIPEEYHERTFEELMRSEEYAEGYILEWDEEVVGYGLTAKTFSQEAGGIVIWLEELYILEAFRSKGLGRQFFQYVEEHAGPEVTRLRLETELDNERARSLYRRLGFKELEYAQMIKEMK
ncbi:MAG TPA: GNAT family N-acetyltransferase [Candidatus Fimimorpha faecalis]|uniref:GNAT family N-acetyltransferase n=1 Tax=Candidatus Fimimorpha faecalis TaxID=2840824 RepID=A0A9D1EEH3_9FIRM|nr:GNAT family N-acetyltransferase [Candidatus Fimimorpha faecalis]